MRTIGRLVSIALTSSILIGCSNDFAPYSRLDRLRVLGVAAEPATPLPGQSTTLSSLTFAPKSESVAYHWSWCPAGATASNQYVCPLDDTTAAQGFGPYVDPAAGPLPGLDLGSAATTLFVNPFSTATLAQLCAAGITLPTGAEAFECEGGFPVVIVLDISTTSASLRAGFVLRLPVGDAPELNGNPVPDALALGGLVLGDSATLAASPGQKVDLQVAVPPSAAELRAIPASEGGSGQRLERLTASWFADAGAIDSDRTSFIDGETTLAEAAQNHWTAPSVETWPADGQVELAVVLRDDRGGVGWLVRHLTLERLP